MKKMVAMIPVRLSSTRIPRKNLRLMHGKPLMQYAVDLAREAEVFGDEIWVSASETELRRHVERMGARYHARAVEHSINTATNRGFTYDFLVAHDCEYVIMINTTSPLLRAATINSFIDYVDKTDFDTVVSVVPERAESFFNGKPLNFDIGNKVNSQNLVPIEKIVWALTAWRRNAFIERYEKGIEPVFGCGNIGIFEIPKDESCDLDTPEDWNIAEGILTARALQKEAEYYRYDL